MSVLVPRHTSGTAIDSLKRGPWLWHAPFCGTSTEALLHESQRFDALGEVLVQSPGSLSGYAPSPKLQRLASSVHWRGLQTSVSKTVQG